MNLTFVRSAAVAGAMLGCVCGAAADEGLTPVFYGAGTGDMAPFEGLSVFQDAIPAYAISGVMKPRLRPFTKHDEYPKKYVRRIPDAERRTTPYNVTDLFAHPEKTVDSDYAKNGRPFFVYERVSRPPYFLPGDGCPLADRAAFAAWKKAHPGFLGFNSLWELDSDTSYFTRFWDGIPDKALAQDLHAGFESPHAKGLGHLISWVKEIFRRGRDFHWGEGLVWPMCSNDMGFEHIFAANGAKGLWYEATTQSIGAWNCASAFLRGAARQHGLDYCWYMAQYYTGYDRQGKPWKGDSRWYDPKAPDQPCELRYRGEGRSQHRRQIAYGWLIGAKYMQTEGWGAIYRDWKDGRVVPSENALDLNEIYELSKRTDRGEPFTPLAVLTPLAEPSSSSYNNQKLLEPETQRTIFDTLVPIRGDSGEKRPDRRRGEQGCLYNSEFAGFFDVLCPDAGQDSAAFAKALGRYRHVLVAGDAFDRAKFDAKALAAFERSGGKVHRYPSPECDTPERLRALLRSIQDETLPVSVEGDIQWGVNRVGGPKGDGAGGRWLVYLINNKGVVKYCNEPEEYDLGRTAKVTVTLKTTGERRTVEVKPGDFALVEFAAADSSAAQIAAERKAPKGKFAYAQSVTEPKTWRSADGSTLPYRLHVPASPRPGAKYPLVIHMHGAGSRGSDNARQIATGGGDFLDWARRRGEEFVFLAPQCPNDRKWVDVDWRTESHRMADEPTPYLRLAMEIVADALERYPVDRDRVYVMGISMGGYATWELLQRRPEWFAAALPCCGGGDVALAARMKDVAVWAFHGDADPVVPVVRSRSMVEALRASGCDVRYREYPGCKHNAWTPTFTDDAVFDWMWSRRRTR